MDIQLNQDTVLLANDMHAHVHATPVHECAQHACTLHARVHNVNQCPKIFEIHFSTLEFLF